MEMNVMYTCDNNYVWLMGISVISLFENNKDFKELDVYLLGENISDENKKNLFNISKNYGREIKIIDVPKIDLPQSLISSRWPLSAFTRLYAGDFLPQNLNRVLYLDCDTVVEGSIRELESIQLDNNIVMGVKDCISADYKRNIGLNENDIYINAGVLLFNLGKLREIDITKIVDNYLKNYKNYINYADQDILNGIFKNKIGILEPCYDVMTIFASHSFKEISILRKPTNFYSENELACAVSNPSIIHFTTNMLVVRPWYNNSNHPYLLNFNKYKNISLWSNKTIGDMSFNSKEYKLIKVVNKLPYKFSFFILGLMHSKIKPRFIRLKARYLR